MMIRGQGTRRFAGTFFFVGFLVLIVIANACVFSGCGENKGKTSINVRLKWLFFPNYSGAPVADKMGLFPKNWEVNIKPGGFEANSILLVEAGTAQFGVTSAIELIQARAQGIRIKALAVVYQKSPITMITLRTSGISSVSDFPGNIAGMKYGTNTELMYYAMLKAANVDPSTIRTVPVKFSTMPLIETTVDIFPSYYMTDPVNLLADGHEIITINPHELGIHCYGNVLFAHEDYIEKKPEIVRAFVNAWREGWLYAVGHPAETAQLFSELNPAVPIENHAAILRRTIPYLTITDGSMSDFGKMTIQKWENTVELLKASEGWNEYPHSSFLAAEDCFTTKFLTGI